MAWADKDDAIDWQAYFHMRNRLIVASIYGPDNPEAMLKNMQKSTAKHYFCMEYSTIAIQNEAMRDFLAGPDQLFDILESSLPVSYTHLTLPTIAAECRSRWSPYH